MSDGDVWDASEDDIDKDIDDELLQEDLIVHFADGETSYYNSMNSCGEAQLEDVKFEDVEQYGNEAKEEQEQEEKV